MAYDPAEFSGADRSSNGAAASNDRKVTWY